MSVDLILIIIFYGLIILYYLRNKNKFEIQNNVFAIYRTKIGLKLMDKARRFSRFFNFISYISIAVGFFGMGLILYYLIIGTMNLVTRPGSAPALAPVIPGVEVQGLPVLSFWYWIIAILFVAVVHEFCHGIFARVYNIKIKSSGFAFLGPILAAFVEPDEKELVKKNKREQLAVFSAGPFANILSGGIILLIAILLSPVTSSLYEYKGVQVYDLEEGFPAILSGLKKGEIVESINNLEILNNSDFVNSLKELKRDDVVYLKTNNGSYEIKAVENPKEPGKGYLGLMISQYKIDFKKDLVEKYGRGLLNIFVWIGKLFFWLFTINLGVGLFNLLPLGPVDGGRMFNTGLSYFIKDKEKVKKIYLGATFMCLSLIIINLLPWIWKFLLYLYNGLLFVLAII